MYVVSVTVFVKSEFVEPFIEATFDNATNTRKEPGNVRFDVLQSEEDPTRFLLYEAYREKEGHAAHQRTERSTSNHQAVSAAEQQRQAKSPPRSPSRYARTRNSPATPLSMRSSAGRPPNSGALFG